MTPEILARIAANREAAKLRKAAKAAQPVTLPPFDLSPIDAKGKLPAPATAPKGGEKPNVSRKSKAAKPVNCFEGPNTWNWPNDQSLSMLDEAHRKAGWWAVETVNPNAWAAGSNYMFTTKADIVLTQEVKLPSGYQCDQAE